MQPAPLIGDGIMCLAAISPQLVERAGVILPGAERRELELRGRASRLAVWPVADSAGPPATVAANTPRRWWRDLPSVMPERFLGLTERSVWRANSDAPEEERPSPP